MKNSIKNIIAAGCVTLGLGLGMTSCVGDLDVMPNDPNSLTWADVEKDPDKYLPEVFAKCYSVLAVSGQTGDGSSDMAGLDGGASCFSRAIYMLNEFPTDETLWIWPDIGIVDLVTGTWTNGNANIYGTYSRLYIAISICNDFLRQTAGGIDLVNTRTDYNCTAQFRLEARAIRALCYWYVLDLFGNGSWADDQMQYGDEPTPITRRELYTRLTEELESIISEWPAANATPTYGRVGLDGVKALLAKVYLNARVYTDGEVDGYARCLELCDEIIANHRGGGFNGSGLAQHWHALFAAQNDRYMPGGSNTAENEILWGVPYDRTYVQAYGGSRFLMAAAFANKVMDTDGCDMAASDYNILDQWGCMHARPEFSDKFTDPSDVRDDLWLKEDHGFTRENTVFNVFNNGYAVVKFTNLYTQDDGSFFLKDPAAGLNVDNFDDECYDRTVDGTVYGTGSTSTYPDTDLPILRLADIYLMKAECFIVGGQGNATEALEAVNFVRQRAGAAAWTNMPTESDLLDERARELYWENHRRTDLVRFDRFTSGYTWSWKGNVAEGTDMGSHMNVYPIPANVIAAQPEFATIQNPGY